MIFNSFIFDSFSFDVYTKTLKLNYSFDGELNFTETITFPSDKILQTKDIEALNHIFKYIHLIAGISYYKLFIPKNIKIKTFDLTKEEALFLNDFYINGLGEFSYKNNIKCIQNIINFPYKDGIQNTYCNYNLNKQIVVPVGGGKDSIVTIETLKQQSKQFICCSVNTAKAIEETIRIADVPYFQIKRIIDLKLLDINKNIDFYQVYNGHVPITGILAFIMCAGSIIYSYDTIYISNEKSASIGNVEFCGNMINHQWSKSLEFEKKVNDFFKKYLLKDFSYVSFLRPFYEYKIAEVFSKLTEYHKIFTSCNKAFKIENRIDNWCCNCDKCRFVFLILSNFLNKNKMVEIFGKNLLDDIKQLDGFKMLVGLKDIKPFECVGEIEESICAMLNVDESFKNDCIVVELNKILEGRYNKDKLKEKYLGVYNVDSDV